SRSRVRTLRGSFQVEDGTRSGVRWEKPPRRPHRDTGRGEMRSAMAGLLRGGGMIGGRHWRPGQAFGGWRRGALDLLHQPAEMRGLNPVEAAGTVLGRIAPGVQRLADEGALRLAARVR